MKRKYSVEDTERERIKLSEMEKKTLRLLREYGEMTEETAEIMGLHFFIYRLSSLGLIERFSLMTEIPYSQSEQRRIGFYGGIQLRGDNPTSVRHCAHTIKITIKGHAAIRWY